MFNDMDSSLFDTINKVEKSLNREEFGLLHRYRKERNRFIHGSYSYELRFKNIEIKQIIITLNKILDTIQ